MTRKQEYYIKKKVGEWLVDKGVAPEQRPEQLAAWVRYFDEMATPVLQLAACKWMCTDTVRLPEDMPKVEQAVRVAKKNKVDPVQYERPMDIIDAFGTTELKERPIDPDTVSTLHLVKRFDSGLAIYDVDDTQESRENMRAIINTHFGKDCSPWCLLQGDGKGNLTEDSQKYWDHYSAYPKQVAFVDGHLAAFSANDRLRKVWWDRKDQAQENVVLNGKILRDQLGRSADKIFNMETGEIEKYENVVRHNNVSGVDIVEKYDNIKSITPSGFEVEGYYADSIKGKVVIPERTTRISGSAFSNCSSVTDIYIPDSVTEIGAAAFSFCRSLKEVRIPSGVRKIQWDMFWGCSSLKEVYIPDGVTAISSCAFRDCISLTKVYIPDSVQWFGNGMFGVFSNCRSLKNINIPPKITAIPRGFFSSCSSLEDIYIPDSVTEIGVGAFYGCFSLAKIHVPSGIRKINDYAFRDCSSLKEIHIPDSVTEIGQGAFEGCLSLDNVYIPDGVKKIGGRVFHGCTSLKEVRIPDGVTEIDIYAFIGCSSLKTISIPEGIVIESMDIPAGCKVIRRISSKTIGQLKDLGLSDRDIEIISKEHTVWANTSIGRLQIAYNNGKILAGFAGEEKKPLNFIIEREERRKQEMLNEIEGKDVSFRPSDIYRLIQFGLSQEAIEAFRKNGVIEAQTKSGKVNMEYRNGEILVGKHKMPLGTVLFEMKKNPSFLNMLVKKEASAKPAIPLKAKDQSSDISPHI